MTLFCSDDSVDWVSPRLQPLVLLELLHHIYRYGFNRARGYFSIKIFSRVQNYFNQQFLFLCTILYDIKTVRYFFAFYFVGYISIYIAINKEILNE